MAIEAPGTDVLIRRAMEHDADAFRELRMDALSRHPEAFAADYESERDRPISDWRNQLRRNDGVGSVIYLAGRDDRLIGMAGGFRGFSFKTRHSATLWGVYVRPDQRGRGTGVRLVRACLGWATEQGVEIVKLAVVSTNASAIRCYEKCGFSAYGVEPRAVRYDGIDYDELLMAKTMR